MANKRLIESLTLALIEALEEEDESYPEGYAVESTEYTITFTVPGLMARANLIEEEITA